MLHIPWRRPEKAKARARLAKSVNPILRGCKWRVRKPSALVVDDDADIPPVVELALARFAISCESVNDGAVAISRLRASTYDLVVLDLAMPGTTGFDVLRVMKKDSRLRRIPVIVLTANNGDEALARSFG